MYRLKIIVEDVKGKVLCWLRKEIQSKLKICIYALSALIPYITAAYRETEGWINAVEVLQCSDPENTEI